MQNTSSLVALLLHARRPPALRTDQVGRLVQRPARSRADLVEALADGGLHGSRDGDGTSAGNGRDGGGSAGGLRRGAGVLKGIFGDGRLGAARHGGGWWGLAGVVGGRALVVLVVGDVGLFG